MTFSTLWWGLPFVGVLGSLALLPLAAPSLWHHHFSKIVGLFSFSVILSLLTFKNRDWGLTLLLETLFHHYIPFILLIAALYITAGGIHLSVRASPSAGLNTALIAFATAVAGWIGTTGAAMVFIRPLLVLNQHRQHRQHLVVFFILLVCNIGGALTPLGDPPLFLGFLEGVDFLWPLKNLIKPVLILVVPLLGLFYYWDRRQQTMDFSQQQKLVVSKRFSVQVRGYENMAYLGFIVLLILGTSLWHPSLCFSLRGLNLPLNDVVRDVGLILISVLSYGRTSTHLYHMNEFSWDPLKEVIILFAAIFITAMPVLEMLKAGTQGPFQTWLPLIQQENGHLSPSLVFWTTGLLSSFLDNAPTYLVFFHLAGGDAETLMTTLKPLLVAISAGAVFMGAMTYIGNAPNFMVKAMAESHGIKMPSFFGYIVWSSLLLLPLLAILCFCYIK